MTPLPEGSCQKLELIVNWARWPLTPTFPMAMLWSYVLLALNSFADILMRKTVLVQIDNMATSFYLNKQGETGSLSLFSKTVAIWETVLG